MAEGPAQAPCDAMWDGDAEAQGRLRAPGRQQGGSQAMVPPGQDAPLPPPAVSHVAPMRAGPGRLVVVHWPGLEEHCLPVLKIPDVKATGAVQGHLVTGGPALVTLPCCSLWGHHWRGLALGLISHRACQAPPVLCPFPQGQGRARASSAPSLTGDGHAMRGLEFSGQQMGRCGSWPGRMRGWFQGTRPVCDHSTGQWHLGPFLPQVLYLGVRPVSGLCS